MFLKWNLWFMTQYSPPVIYAPPEAPSTGDSVGLQPPADIDNI